MLTPLRKVVLNQEQFCLLGTSEDIRRHFGCHSWERKRNATGIYQVETTGAGQHPTVTGQPSPQELSSPVSPVLGGKTLTSRTTALINLARNCMRLPRSRASVTDQVMR